MVDAMFSFSIIFGFLLLLGVLNVYVNCLHIDVKRKNYVQLNGVKIDANSLHKHLEPHERELIFGKTETKGEVKLVQIERRDQQRHKRSAQSEKDIFLQIQDNGTLVDLKLQQAEKLIDDAFIFIRRNTNNSQLIENSHKLAVNYERCFYRNANSALDLCDDKSLRGIVYHNSTHYVVHPLPDRFGAGSHVIVEFNGGLHSDKDLTENIQFEPQMDVFEALPKEQNSFHFHNKGRNWNSKFSKSNRSHRRRRRRRRHISRQQWKVPQVLYIETAIFVDRDLFKHMAKNYPKNTESQLIRFVLAMINGVQLLYNHPSLGHRINFVLKRLEILHPHPKDLRQSSDIDTYLNNFCMWQRNFNPPSDTDPLHYDHAVILTGLDLYVVGKNGKVSNQVVGLAPVAGMCTSTSSCTINEGKHFESVFVVAHEIGHNLGMRHDTNENSCDPSLYLMSPTLGSGKITWSKCSRTYLSTFLESSQSKCLFDRGQISNKYDHAAEGMLPGERFDANQQCMLKYGRDSVRSPNQIISDICRDLHCQRDRYTWTSHPALEGTECGELMRCRSGVCSMKATFMESYSSSRQISPSNSKQTEKMNLLENNEKSENYAQGYNSYFNKPSTWSEWGEASDCDSGCLYGTSGRLREGSTGLKTYVRRCLDHRRRCQGRDKKFESCNAKQCLTIPKMTIEEFATNICERAQKFDSDLTGEGLQIVGDMEESCKVFCKTKSNGTKSRNWIYPHGTTCRSKEYNFDDTSYCIDGRCERFSCENTTKNFFKIDQYYCPELRMKEEESRKSNNVYKYSEERRIFKTTRVVPTPTRSKFENEAVGRNFQTSNTKWKSEPYKNQWKYPMRLNEKESAESEWEVKSGCHSSCMEKSKGVQVISSRKTRANSIQLCTHKVKPCDRLQSTAEFAEATCRRYKLKVRGLSGFGTQISPSVYDPDRSCRVACQDEVLEHRFYIVNGNHGHFPLGTKCSVSEERYCVNGKCLEFGLNNIASTQSHISLALFRSKRDVSMSEKSEERRSFVSYAPVNITESITQDLLNSIISSLSNEPRSFEDDSLSNDHIEFTNPIHISTDELTTE